MLRIFFIWITLLLSTAVSAETVYITPALDLHFASWEGENAASTDSYSSDSGMLGLGIMLQKGNLYAGLSIRSGQFSFDSPAPAQDDGSLLTAVDLDRAEFDLVTGYYFWPRVALFVDFKSSSTAWSDSSYKLTNSGLGLGVSAYYPLATGAVYGSVGTIRLTSRRGSKEIGAGTGFSTELGWTAKLSATIRYKIALKSQSQIIDFDLSGEQENRIGSLVVGFSKSFSL